MSGQDQRVHTPPDALQPFGPLGFGAMHLSAERRPERDKSIAVVHAALDAGVRVIDTADAYCLTARDVGHNEALVAEAVRTWAGPRSDVIIATKGGHVRDDAGRWLQDGRPTHLRAAAHASRERLGVERIELYQYHRPDPETVWEESIEALAALQEAGVVHHVGVSNASVDQLERASRIITIASVQNEMSPFHIASMPELAWCTEHRVPFLAWAPLGGSRRARALGDVCDTDDAVESNTITAEFTLVARELAASVQQVVLAWLILLSPQMTVIPGASRVETVRDSVGATRVPLTDRPDLLERLTAVVNRR